MLHKLNIKTLLAATILAGTAGFAGTARADIVKKVYSPYVEGGELEVELQSGIDFDHDKDKDGAVQNKIAVGYGFTNRWAAEIYGVMEKSGIEGEETKFTEVSIENRYQLFERGERWIDAGVYLEVAKSFVHHSPDDIEGKLLLEKDFPEIANIANFTLEKEVGPYSGKRLEGGFSWSTRYLYNQAFEPGIEWHSDFGEISKFESYNDQEHQVGPVIYGKLFGNVKYDIGYLFGVSRSAPDGELKTILEYETHF